MSTGPPRGLEPIAKLIENWIETRKMLKQPLKNTRRGKIMDFVIPPKVRIGDWHEVSAIFQGSVKSGYFSLMIQDRDGVKQWFPDENSVGQKLSATGKSIQTGTQNFSNSTYESYWKFMPERPLYAGHAKAIIHMFEDTDVYPLAFQEKDILLI